MAFIAILNGPPTSPPTGDRTYLFPNDDGIMCTMDSTGVTKIYSQSTHNHAGLYEPANSNIQSHISSTSNPHTVTKTQVGLGSVVNSDTTTTTNITDSTNKRFCTDAEKTVVSNTSGVNKGDYKPSITLSIVDAVAVLDASLSDSFYLELGTDNVEIQINNMTDGQNILLLSNEPNSYGTDWHCDNQTILWSGTIKPVQTSGGIDVITIVKLGSYYLASKLPAMGVA